MRDSIWLWFLLGALGITLLMMTSGVNVIERMAKAIQRFEGWFPGSRSYRNNNPGNLKGGAWPGIIGQDKDGFLVFDSFESGWNALKKQLEMAFTGASAVYNPSMTLFEFFSRYAPSSDLNEPARYAAFVAKELDVTPDTKLLEIA